MKFQIQNGHFYPIYVIINNKTLLLLLIFINKKSNKKLKIYLHNKKKYINKVSTDYFSVIQFLIQNQHFYLINILYFYKI